VHVNVNEIRDVVVDVHVHVIGFLIWLRLGRAVNLMAT